LEARKFEKASKFVEFYKYICDIFGFEPKKEVLESPYFYLGGTEMTKDEKQKYIDDNINKLPLTRGQSYTLSKYLNQLYGIGIKEYKNRKNLTRYRHSIDAEKIKKFKSENPTMSNSEIGKIFGLHKNTVQYMTKKNILDNINESFGKQDSLPAFIRHQLELIYKPLGMWGKAPNPNDDCETNTGVIGIFPHSENDVWSILNRFDTNSKVREKMHQIFLQSSPIDVSQRAFENWIEENRDNLFGPDGKYTKELVDLNIITVESGNKNEEYAVDILKKRFPDVPVKRYCSGDVRDTKKGIDITVEHPSGNFNIQVKPFININSYVEPDGDTFFEVKTYLDVNKYSERNVNVFMFVDSTNQKFILFKNKKNKIGQMPYKVVRFYEPPLYTNMTFVTKEKPKSKKIDPTNPIFGVETDVLKNLEFRKSQIDKQIEKRKNQSPK
jgi:hypothetical protein